VVLALPKKIGDSAIARFAFRDIDHQLLQLNLIRLQFNAVQR
jgi:hypothetical protein